MARRDGFLALKTHRLIPCRSTVMAPQTSSNRVMANTEEMQCLPLQASASIYVMGAGAENRAPISCE
jgi:hypothetical protein